jgi:hypothetical protein
MFFCNFDPDFLEFWDPSNQQRAELSFKLTLELWEMVAYEVDNISVATLVSFFVLRLTGVLQNFRFLDK